MFGSVFHEKPDYPYRIVPPCLPGLKRLGIRAADALLASMAPPKYTEAMTSKDMAIKTIQELPDSATWEEIEERVRFLAGIDRGLADIKAGKVVPHEEVKESLKRWLTR